MRMILLQSWLLEWHQQAACASTAALWESGWGLGGRGAYETVQSFLAKEKHGFMEDAL